MHVPHPHMAAPQRQLDNAPKPDGAAPMRTRLNLPFTRLDVFQHVWASQLTHGHLFVPTPSHCEAQTEVELFVTLPEASHPLILEGKVLEAHEGDETQRAGLYILVPLGARERGAVEAYLAGCFEEAHLILQAHRRVKARQSRAVGPKVSGSHAVQVKPTAEQETPEKAPPGPLSASLLKTGFTRSLKRNEQEEPQVLQEAADEDVRRDVEDRKARSGTGILKPGPKSRPSTREVGTSSKPKPASELSDAYLAIIEAADELEHKSKSASVARTRDTGANATAPHKLPSSNSRKYGDILARREAARKAREARYDDSAPSHARRRARDTRPPRRSRSNIISDNVLEKRHESGQLKASLKEAPNTRSGRPSPPRTRLVKKNTGEVQKSVVLQTRLVKVPSAAPVHDSVGLGSSLTGLDMSSSTRRARGGGTPPRTRRVVRKDLDLDSVKTRIFKRDKDK